MPSFDIVSEIDKHELQNAVDQTKKELDTRFDFRGVKTKVESSDKEITLGAPSDFQVKQMADILEAKFIKRNIDPQSLDYQDPEINVQETRQKILIKQGIDKEAAKKIVSLIKNSKLKVQAAIMDEKIRVTAKSRDDLQEVMALVRKQENLGLATQFNNFRD